MFCYWRFCPKKPKAKNGTITIISEVEKGRNKVCMVMEGIALAAKDNNRMSEKSSDMLLLLPPPIFCYN
jgi:hypothetical protein